MADPEQLAREKIDALLGPCGWTVQTLNRNTLDKSARVVISTIQRAYSMLKGETEPRPISMI